MRVRKFRSLGFGTGVLEIGRLRVWVLPGWRPRLYCCRAYGCLLAGVAYVGLMFFLCGRAKGSETDHAE